MDPIRVMVVDDSLVVRRAVTGMLSRDPDIRVVGTAANGGYALAKLDALQPDLILMDLHMPEVDGIAAVRAIRSSRPRLPIIMFSSLTQRGAAATLDALAAGADDYVAKPAAADALDGLCSAREQLVTRIKALTRPARGSGSPRATVPSDLPRPRPAVTPAKRPAVLVIASSTGGPEALAKLLPALPATLPVPILLVQHMPAVFTRQFADRLDRLSALRVMEATDGLLLRAGSVYLAPGDHHLTVRTVGGRRYAALDQSAPENFCRPAANKLFRSVAAAFHGAVLAVVLTGMGSDGVAGAREVRAAGGSVLAQDEASSVIWGMPGGVVEAGLADDILPMAAIPAAICHRLGVTALAGARSTADGLQ